MNFLQKIATLLHDYTGETNHICIVLPNRRAALFLKKELSLLINKPIFLPHITSIHDFVTSQSETTLADEFSQLILLYKSYVSVAKDKAETFDEFVKWGQKLAHDFDETDQHLADPTFIFNYLKEEKNLALWAIDKEPLTPFQKNYLQFFSSLLEIYHAYRNNLTEINLADYGMACRKLAEDMQHGKYKNPYHETWFCGLNALTVAEQQIISHLIKQGNSRSYWDADSFYLNNIHHEAGSFLRKHIDNQALSEISWIDNAFKNSKKTIHIIGVSGNIGQVKALTEQLNTNYSKTESPENTAIVLNDESLLMPLLNSIPNRYENFNITMGYPMKLTPVYSLLDLLFTIQINGEKFQQLKHADSTLYYVKDIQQLFGQPMLAQISPNVSLLRDILLRKNQIFYSPDEIRELACDSHESLQKIIQIIFLPWCNNANTAITQLLLFFDQLKLYISQHSIDTEFLFAMHTNLNLLQDIISTQSINISINTLYIICKQHVSQLQIPFTGEPLKGLQIMGMLETRALDFETVYMLSVNEGVLPQKKNHSSFIPHGIRQEAGLPTYQHQEQIFAYHFYRLLQGAKHIYLYYNTDANSLGGSERSRFINQLIYELPIYNPLISIKEMQINVSPQILVAPQLSIQKTEDILQKIASIGNSGFSPSALNAFRKCSLQYYFKYIADIKETDEIAEIIDQRDFGNYLHETLEELFEPLLAKKLDVDTIMALRKVSTQILSRKMGKGKNKLEATLTGKNYLIFHVLDAYIADFIAYQSKIIQEIINTGGTCEILGLEVPLKGDLSFQLGSQLIDVKIIGKADRIDNINSLIQIIDYKSGSTSNKTFDRDMLFSDIRNIKNEYCFQLYLYLYLFHKNHPEYNHISAGVWGFRRLSEGIKNIFYKTDATDKVGITNFTSNEILKFENLLISLLSELFASDKPFTQTDDIKCCEFCSYKGICRKE